MENHYYEEGLVCDTYGPFFSLKGDAREEVIRKSSFKSR